MIQNKVSQWYETKENVDEMLSFDKLKKWEEKVSQTFPMDANILDIGCGLGREAFALNDKGFSVIGIDISQEVIYKVNQLSQEKGYDIPFTIYDGVTLPFDCESFDVVIIWSQTFGLLYEDAYKASFLKECKRVLRNGGMLSFSGHDYEYINSNYKQFLEGRKFYAYADTEMYWESFLLDELSTYAQNAGFTVVTCERGEIYKPDDGVIIHCLCKK